MENLKTYLELFAKLINNVGVPVGILVYLFWRFDRFLQFVCRKLETYNKEFDNIASTIRDTTEQLKAMRRDLISCIKK